MCIYTHVIISFGVGGKLRTTFSSCPCLRRPDQCGTDSGPANLWFNIPAFNICNTVRITALRIGPNRKFDKTHGLSLPVQSN